MSSLNSDNLSQYLNYPSQPPPPGVTPNFIDPISIAYRVYITGGVCISLMVVFALLRLVSKTNFSRKTINVGEEIAFASGLVLSLAFTSMIIACATGGSFGRHAWDVRLGAFTKPQLAVRRATKLSGKKISSSQPLSIFKLSLLIEIIGPLAICGVKVSVLILYLRVFGILRWMRITSIGGIVIVTAWHFSMAIAFAAMCSPSPSSGDSQLDFLAAYVSTTCNHTRVLVVFQGASNVFIDLFLLILPLPAIWRAQMPLRRKLATSAMFSIGLSACASSTMGLYYRVSYYRNGSDNTYLTIPLWSTSIAEETAGVIVCCLPPAAIVFKSVQRSMLSRLSLVRQRPTGYSSSGILPYKRSENSANFNYSHIYSRSSSNRIWSDTESDSYALLQLQPGNTGIVKKTELEILGRVCENSNGKE